VAKGLIYPMTLFVTLLYSVITGWGLRFEGPNGEQLKKDPTLSKIKA